jgi:hypothetical protein
VGQILNIADYGQPMHETVIKKGLQELNSELHFDMGDKLKIWHPRMDERQGIFLRGKHVCTMDRGNIPEFCIWSLEKGTDGVERKEQVLRGGWRMLFMRLVSKKVTGITWATLCDKFNIGYREYEGLPQDITEVAS